MSSNPIRCFGSILLVITSCPALVSADEIVDWNRITSEVLVTDTNYQNPGMASRSMAMVNLAMYDAVNGVIPRHQQMYSHAPAPVGANANAAAVEAAYHVLSSIYPEQQAYLQGERTSSLSMIPDGPGKTDGVAFGAAVGATVMQARANDGFDNMVPYVPQTGAGHWEPDPLNPTQEAWGPEWGQLETFALQSSGQMMPPAMPDLTSQAYTDAFNEVKELGSVNSTSRTPEQTEIALFWAYDRLGMGTPMRLYSDIMCTVATSEGNDLSDNARMFAMTATSVADAGIVAWDSKFQFDFWRPVSGIRRADEDGNPDTIADPNWTPMGAPGGIGPDGEPIPDFTPPFPTYLSGHASFGGAMFRSLENFFGSDDIAFEIGSEEMPGITRSFSSFSEASEENSRSRVYLGIHWNFDDTEARTMGSSAADFIAANHFQIVPEPSAVLLTMLGAMCLVARSRQARR